MNKKIVWICAIIVLVCALIFANNYLKEKQEEKVIEQIRSASAKQTAENHSSSVSSEEVIQVTSKNFADVVLNSGKTVMIDFYADWCPPCRALSPIIDEVASENTDENLVFVRLNIDDEEAISNEYGIRSIPTLVLIKNGEEVDRSIGYIEKEDVINFVNK